MTLPPAHSIRLATVDDAELIQSHRTAMFTEMGSDPAKLARVHETGVQWHRRMLADGRYTGLLAEMDGQVVAGVGLLWNDLPPNADTAGTVRAYLMNVYVDPGRRGRALARTLVQAALDECRARGVEIVTLTASEAGRPTYDRLGFVAVPEMKLLLGEASG